MACFAISRVVCVCMFVCVCLCVCLWERESARMCVCVCAYICVCLCVYMCVYARQRSMHDAVAGKMKDPTSGSKMI